MDGAHLLRLDREHDCNDKRFLSAVRSDHSYVGECKLSAAHDLGTSPLRAPTSSELIDGSQPRLVSAGPHIFANPAMLAGHATCSPREDLTKLNSRMLYVELERYSWFTSLR